MTLEKSGEKIVKLLASAGWQAFFVGGFVRNNLLKLTSDNIDIATDATPEVVEKILTKQKIKVKPVGKKFGSILAIVDGFAIEITTFRKEGRYSDNRHPDEVEFIKEYLDDAKRRDFTINALYFDPIKKELFDPANGLKDLKGKLLKFVGDPKKRIDEDALRMMRGVRLATQLGLKLEKNSFAAIKTRAKYIQDISGERVKAELDKILLSDQRIHGLKLLDQTGLLKFISPDLNEAKKHFTRSKIYHQEGSRFVHALLVVDSLEILDLDLIYAALFHDVGKNVVQNKTNEPWVNVFREHIKASVALFEQFAKRLKFSTQSIKKIVWLIGHHDHDIVFEGMPIKDKINFVSNQYSSLELDLWQADIRGNKTHEAISDHHSNRWHAYNAACDFQKLYESKKLLIEKLAKGDLIMKYSSLKPGRELGQKIEDVKVQIILGKIKNEKDLKEYLNS